MKKLFTIIITLFFATQIFAQADSTIKITKKVAKIYPQNYTHSVGLGAGFSSGYGFSYRYFPGRAGLQVNFAPYLSQNSSVVSVGALGLLSLERTRVSDFYMYFGGHLWSLDNSSRSHTMMFYGMGPAIQINLSDRLSWDIMVGYGGSQTITYKIKNPREEQRGYFRFGYTIETAFYFRF